MQEWLREWGQLAQSASLRPHLTLWLGLAVNHQWNEVYCQTRQEEAALQHIMKEDTSDPPATMLRGPRHTTAQPSRQQQQLSAPHQQQP